MSALTEWFEGRSADERHEKAYWSRILTEIACAVCVGLILAGLPGCATQEEAKYCFFQYVGQTASGLSVAQTYCVTPEKFAEMQK